MNVDPDTAVVRGAADALENLSEIDLKAVDLSDHDTGFTLRNVAAGLPGNVQLQYPDTNAFTLQFRVYEPVVTRTVSGIPVDVLDVPEGKRGVVEPSEITLEIRGPRRDLKRLKPEEISAEVRPSADGSPTIRQARVNLPPSMSLAGGQPDRRAVRVRLEDKK